MQKKLHIIWVTVLTLVALLLSSAVTSAPLMPLQMLAESQTTQMTMLADYADTHCVSSPESMTSDHQKCCITDNMTSDHHQCCYSNCVASYTILPSPVFAFSQTANLVLISKEPISRVSSIASALFRPPIA